LQQLLRWSVSHCLADHHKCFQDIGCPPISCFHSSKTLQIQRKQMTCPQETPQMVCRTTPFGIAVSDTCEVFVCRCAVFVALFFFTLQMLQPDCCCKVVTIHETLIFVVRSPPFSVCADCLFCHQLPMDISGSSLSPAGLGKNSRCGCDTLAREAAFVWQR